MHLIISANKIKYDQLFQLSEDDLKSLGLSEFDAGFLVIRLKSLREVNIRSDVNQQPSGSLISKNPSYADVTKHSGSISSSSTKKLDASLDGEDNTTPKCIRGKDKLSISAEEVLRTLGLENTRFPGEWLYEFHFCLLALF